MKYVLSLLEKPVYLVVITSLYLHVITEIYTYLSQICNKSSTLKVLERKINGLRTDHRSLWKAIEHSFFGKLWSTQFNKFGLTTVMKPDNLFMPYHYHIIIFVSADRKNNQFLKKLKILILKFAKEHDQNLG